MTEIYVFAAIVFALALGFLPFALRS
jgi:hypothetical protein